MDDADGDSSSGSSENELLTNFLARKNTVLPMSCLQRALDAIAGPRPSVGRKAKNADTAALVGRKAKIVAAHTALEAPLVDSHCADRSHLPMHCSHTDTDNRFSNSLAPLMREMRLCLLAADWDGYKALLLVLLRSSNLKKHYALYAVRSCFALLLNHPARTPEMLDDFMASCLNMPDDRSGSTRYLRSCFDLQRTEDVAEDVLESKMDIADDDEEMFFDADFSSDD